METLRAQWELQRRGQRKGDWTDVGAKEGDCSRPAVHLNTRQGVGLVRLKERSW